MKDRALRDHVVAMLGWEDAHAGFEQITEGVPADKWGALAPGLPYSLWQLLEHLRLAQHDILDPAIDTGVVIDLDHHRAMWCFLHIHTIKAIAHQTGCGKGG